MLLVASSKNIVGEKGVKLWIILYTSTISKIHPRLYRESSFKIQSRS